MKPDLELRRALIDWSLGVALPSILTILVWPALVLLHKSSLEEIFGGGDLLALASLLLMASVPGILIGIIESPSVRKRAGPLAGLIICLISAVILIMFYGFVKANYALIGGDLSIKSNADLFAKIAWISFVVLAATNLGCIAVRLNLERSRTSN